MKIPNNYSAAADLLTGRNILITGAGDGIGRAAARSFAAHGATVIMLGRTLAKLEEVYDQIVGDGGPEPIIHCMDLKTTQEEPYIELADSIRSELGVLHGVLHNASVLGQRTPIENIVASAWNEVLQVNLTSAFLLSKHLISVMREADDGSIVFTSSGVGRQGRAYWGAYSVSKFGIEALSQILADELVNTSSIRVNCVNPGGTRTAMRQAAYPAEKPDQNPLPDELMPTYLYLIGPDSRGVNGASFDAQ